MIEYTVVKEDGTVTGITVEDELKEEIKPEENPQQKPQKHSDKEQQG